MKVVASILNSVGRYESGEPINETLFSVIHHEDRNQYSLWVGLPPFDENFCDYDSKDCLDICASVFWKETMEENIKLWMAYISNLTTDEIEGLEKERDKIEKQLQDARYVRDRLREVL